MFTKRQRMRSKLANAGIFALAWVLSACGGGGSGGTAATAPPPPPPVTVPDAPAASVDVGLKQLIFSWAAVSGATSYRLLENPDGESGFTQVGDDIPSDTLTVSRPIAVHLHDFANSLYIVEACNTAGCTGSAEVNAIDAALDAIGYFKASNSDAGDEFGHSLALSADGRTVAVGTIYEASASTGVNGPQNDNRALFAGAAYLFRLENGLWSQQAYFKASNNSSYHHYFGGSVALSEDGNTLAVGGWGDDGASAGVNGDEYYTDFGNYNNSGAVYLFRFENGQWFQQAYIKASNPEFWANFGWSTALSGDGNTLAVGAHDENGDSLPGSGAAYVFRFDGVEWYQQAYLKASNPSRIDQFGYSIGLSADGNTLVIGAPREDGPGFVGDAGFAKDSGAAYVFRFDGTTWAEQAYLKASNYTLVHPLETGNFLGQRVAISGDGTVVAAGAIRESGAANGINGDETDISARAAGAAYVFRLDDGEWRQEAYVKAFNTFEGGLFGNALALNQDGSLLAVGGSDGSAAIGIDGDQTDVGCRSGTAYLYRFDGTEWLQSTYIKAPNNTCDWDGFAETLSIAADGSSLAIGAPYEDGGATGVSGDQADDSKSDSGAVLIF